MAGSSPPNWDEIERLSPIDSPSKIFNDSYLVEDEMEVLIMDIEIGDGRHDEIRVKKGQLPSSVAHEFCKKHGLSYTIQTALAENIENNLKLASAQMGSNPETPCDISSQTISRNKRSASSDTQCVQKSNHIPRINANSKKMLEGKLQGNVYERLHRQAQKPRVYRQAESLEQSMKKVNMSNSGVNYGQMLYYKGLVKKSQTESYLKEMREDQIKEILKEATFTPNINSTLNISRNNFTPETLIEKGKQRDVNLENLKKAAMELEMSNCTFNPQICPKSKLISKIKKVNEQESDRFNSLYKDAKARNQRQDQESSDM
jgi:hypothetical protein